MGFSALLPPGHARTDIRPGSAPGTGSFGRAGDLQAQLNPAQPRKRGLFLTSPLLRLLHQCKYLELVSSLPGLSPREKRSGCLSICVGSVRRHGTSGDKTPRSQFKERQRR
jgi:hypothetical protein